MLLAIAKGALQRDTMGLPVHSHCNESKLSEIT